MKRRRNTVVQLSILVFLGLGVLLSLVLPQVAANYQHPQLILEISVVTREKDLSTWGNIRLGMEQAAAEYGAELRFLTLEKENSRTEQMALLERETQRGADGVILVPAAEDILTEMAGQSIDCAPVMTMESEAPTAAGAILPDNSALGRALAEEIVSDAPEGTILLLQTSYQSPGIAQRIEAAEEFLEERGYPTQIVSASLDRLPVSVLEYQGCAAFAAFEPAATEILAALKRSWEMPVGLYGVGLTSKIAVSLETGDVDAAVTISDYAAGYLAVESMVKTIQYQPVTSEPLPYYVVRRGDLDDPDYQKLLFPVGA